MCVLTLLMLRSGSAGRPMLVSFDVVNLFVYSYILYCAVLRFLKQ
jgi:hypothetical protein